MGLGFGLGFSLGLGLGLGLGFISLVLGLTVGVGLDCLGSLILISGSGQTWLGLDLDCPPDLLCG